MVFADLVSVVCSAGRVDPSDVAPLEGVRSKGRKRLRDRPSEAELQAGMAANTQWGAVTLVSQCRGGWNVDFGDGKLWYLAQNQFTVV